MKKKILFKIHCALISNLKLAMNTFLSNVTVSKIHLNSYLQLYLSLFCIQYDS